MHPTSDVISNASSSTSFSEQERSVEKEGTSRIEENSTPNRPVPSGPEMPAESSDCV